MKSKDGILLDSLVGASVGDSVCSSEGFKDDKIDGTLFVNCIFFNQKYLNMTGLIDTFFWVL